MSLCWYNVSLCKGWWVILQSIAGLVIFTLLACLFSESWRKVSLRGVFVALALQLGLAVVLLKVPIFQEFFLSLNQVILALEESTKAGTSMVFGYLGGGPLPFEEKMHPKPG